MSNTVLILGASGKFGSHCANAFEAAGWLVRRFDRKTDDPERAAQGADVIVNAMNPPDYRNWDVEIPRITALAIRAARASGATLIVPGNVYNFGRQPAPWGPDTPQKPVTQKGRVRARMEQDYHNAVRDHDIHVILLRAGDFIDNRPKGTWLGDGILSGWRKGRFTYPGRSDIPHAWAYLPDLGRAALALAEQRADLPAYADIPFPGYTLSGEELAAAVEEAGKRKLRRAGFPWWMVRLVSPFVPAAPGLREMRYLWDTPHSLDASRFAQYLPHFTFTPLTEALRPVMTQLQGSATSTQTSR